MGYLVTWTADPDAGPDELYEGEYSIDGCFWLPLFSPIDALSYDWDTSGFEDGAEAIVRVRATTGSVEGSWVESGSFFIGDPILISLRRASGSERVFLIAMEFNEATLYLTTGARDLLWNSQVWTAVGGNLALGQLEESNDTKGQGIDLVLSGVDQAIVSILLEQGYRGRSVEVSQAFLHQQTGEVVGVLELFVGSQLDPYEVDERVQRNSPGTVTIRTRARHRLSTDEFRGIVANVHAHQRYAPGDLFFQHVASLAGKRIFWGIPAPAPTGGGGGDGGQNDYGTHS